MLEVHLGHEEVVSLQVIRLAIIEFSKLRENSDQNLFLLMAVVTETWSLMFCSEEFFFREL